MAYRPDSKPPIEAAEALITWWLLFSQHCAYWIDRKGRKTMTQFHVDDIVLKFLLRGTSVAITMAVIYALFPDFAYGCLLTVVILGIFLGASFIAFAIVVLPIMIVMGMISDRARRALDWSGERGGRDSSERDRRNQGARIQLRNSSLSRTPS